MVHEIDRDQSVNNRVLIREALLHDWEPIGISDIPEAKDEYDAYADVVLNSAGCTGRGIPARHRADPINVGVGLSVSAERFRCSVTNCCEVGFWPPPEPPLAESYPPAVAAIIVKLGSERKTLATIALAKSTKKEPASVISRNALGEGP